MHFKNTHSSLDNQALNVSAELQLLKHKVVCVILAISTYRKSSPSDMILGEDSLLHHLQDLNQYTDELGNLINNRDALRETRRNT